jgi:hypothetical protein
MQPLCHGTDRSFNLCEYDTSGTDIAAWPSANQEVHFTMRIRLPSENRPLWSHIKSPIELRAAPNGRTNYLDVRISASSVLINLVTLGLCIHRSQFQGTRARLVAGTKVTRPSA